MGDNWARCIALLLTVSIAGCGTLRDLPICQRPGEFNKKNGAANPVWPGAKVALAGGRFKPPNALEVYPSGERAPVTNPAIGAGAGALVGTASCLQYAVLMGPFVIICVPVGAVGGAVAGAVSAADNASKANTPANQEKAAKVANVKAGEQRVVAGVEFVDLNHLLLEQVKQYAHDSGIDDLSELTGQGPTSLGDSPQYHGNQDFVFELVLTGSVVEETYDTLYVLRLFIQGRLIRIADNSVVGVFTTSGVTDAKTANDWNAENGKLVTEELNKTMQRVAKTSVEQWIRPVISGASERPTTVVIFRPSKNAGRFRSMDISIDGCIVGALSNDSFLTVETSAGKHIIRSEGFSFIGGVKGADTVNVNYEPGTTHYLLLDAEYGFNKVSRKYLRANFPDYQELVR